VRATTPAFAEGMSPSPAAAQVEALHGTDRSQSGDATLASPAEPVCSIRGSLHPPGCCPPCQSLESRKKPFCLHSKMLHGPHGHQKTLLLMPCSNCFFSPKFTCCKSSRKAFYSAQWRLHNVIFLFYSASHFCIDSRTVTFRNVISGIMCWIENVI